jgi:hypothetical protein
MYRGANRSPGGVRERWKRRRFEVVFGRVKGYYESGVDILWKNRNNILDGIRGSCMSLACSHILLMNTPD